jgi:O-antigen ligase
MMILQNLFKVFPKSVQSKLNFIFFLYLISYLIGPAIINIYVTLLAIFSLFYLFKNYNFLTILIKDRSSFLFILLFAYILIKDFFLGTFNIDILSLLRFIIIFLSISLFTIKENKSFSINFVPIIIFILILFFDTFFQYIFGINLFGFSKFQSDRLTSFFNDEPIIGSFLMKLSLPIIFFLINIKIKKAYLYIFTFLSIFCVVISGERMPFLQLCFGIFLIFLILFGLDFKKMIMFVLIFLVISVASLNLPNIKERYISTFQGIHSLYFDIKSENEIIHQNSINGIYHYYLNFQSGIQLWKKNFLFGNGYRYYNQNCKLALPDKFNIGCSTHPHNIYIELLSDHGILGLILFIFLILFLSYDYIKYSRNSSAHGFLITLIVITVPFVTSQSIFSSFYGSIFFLYFFIIKFMTKIKVN